MSDQIFNITTPIYYVNGPPHIAHAYTSVNSDVIARFMRLDGRKVWFVTGTDEHGQKVAQAARAEGCEPLEFCDRISARFQDMNRLMNISHDDFIRTTEPRHKNAVRAMWEKLKASGYIYEGVFAGWYSVRDEQFFDEAELVDGQAPTGAPVEWVEERNLFFRLSAFGEALLEFYDSHPDFIAPASRRNEVVGFVREGLRDLSISRASFDWGIPVPGHPGQVTYVWLDALLNYATSAGYPDSLAANGVWPADVHVVGKDIIRFHCVFWPAFLMAADLPLPKRVFAHGWWTVEGEKMSKSLDNFIPPERLTERFGVDGVRFFLVREMAFGADGDMTEVALQRRIVGELGNEFGNLAHRTLTMIARYCDGRTPAPGVLTAQDEALLAQAAAMLPALRLQFGEQALQAATQVIWNVVGAANKYLQDEAPWTRAKGDPDRLKTILHVAAETLRRLALVLQPFVPDAAANLLDQLGVGPQARSFASFDQALVAGAPLPDPRVLFPRPESAPPPAGAMPSPM
ncbi:methionine--tRNA ligase [Caulobacter sp. NIBR1757]|uniref:methionine--tRNA ligase n=1 Tax=Caulobacter sp. NIBR1757 TaxID=3016000 RepID=UPI0022F11251|nr:methionine--tRNA ligase [Caulobacter sp. NIBR1757]WGM40022.1 Methionine--tRNA ligase [Caulobacter sp. NIBR1757]